MKAKSHGEKIWFLSTETGMSCPPSLMKEAVKATFHFQLGGRDVCVCGGEGVLGVEFDRMDDFVLHE